MTDLTIDAFQRHIRQRYHATDARRGTPATWLWFTEEVGELAHALGKRHAGEDDPANVAEEFADVFAWLCTLANINDVNLAEAAASKYLGQAPPEGVK